MDVNDKISVFIKLYFPAAVKCWKDTSNRDEEGNIIYNEDGSPEGAIPVLFTLAQAGLESDWGAKAPEFNFFGMTPGKNWKGKRQILPTKEDFSDNNRTKHPFPVVKNITPYKDKKGDTRYIWDVMREFRAYDSAADGFTDHGRFLEEAGWYSAAFEFSDPKKFAQAVTDAGYATSPVYATSLRACIDSIAKRLPLLGLQVPTA